MLFHSECLLPQASILRVQQAVCRFIVGSPNHLIDYNTVVSIAETWIEQTTAVIPSSSDSSIHSAIIHTSITHISTV